MVLQRLVPYRVPRVAQGLCTKLVGLEPPKQTEGHPSVETTWRPSLDIPLSEAARASSMETDMAYSGNEATHSEAGAWRCFLSPQAGSSMPASPQRRQPAFPPPSHSTEEESHGLDTVGRYSPVRNTSTQKQT